MLSAVHERSQRCFMWTDDSHRMRGVNLVRIIKCVENVFCHVLVTHCLECVSDKTDNSLKPRPQLQRLNTSRHVTLTHCSGLK